MMINTILLVAGPLVAPLQPVQETPNLLAIKVGRAETISQGTLEHAVILIEDGKIVTIGEDLPIDRGIPVLDRDPEWTVMPGMVNPYSRAGLDSRGGNDSQPQLKASGEIFPGQEIYGALLELGVTTLGLYPAGNGIPGRAVAVRPFGDTIEDMVLRDDAYLKIRMRANSSTKKMISKGFEKADGWIDKEQKAREKWEKADEKAKKKKKKKDEEEDEDKGPGPYVAPDKDGQAEAFLALRNGDLSAVITITTAAEYLHTLDAIGDEEFDWSLRFPVVREANMFHVKREIGLGQRRIMVEPSLSVHPGTMRQRNLPMEFAEAGARLVLVPRADTVDGHKDWMHNTAEIVAAGLDRDVALRALTLEPAEALGLGERLGSIEEGKDANLIFLNGDPFETGTKIEAVMLEGQFKTGEVEL